MRIEAKGQHLVLAGAFDLSGNKRTLADRLVAAGATVAGSMSSRTTAVVIGRSTWSTNAENHARQRGLPVLDEAQAIAMIEDGFIEIEEDAAPDTPIDALIGEARGLLDGTPDARTWDALVALLDRCAPEHERALTDYLAAALDRWRIPPDTRYSLADNTDYDAREWADRSPSGIVRVAPRHWLTEALQGEDHAKFTLARAMMTTRMGLTNKELIRVLENEGFANVRSLDLGEYQAKRSGAVYTALAASAMAENLEELRVTTFKRTHARATQKPSALSLKRMRFVVEHDQIDADALRTLWSSSWTEHLTELTFESHYSYHGAGDGLDGFAHVHGIERVVLESHTWLDMLAPFLHAPLHTESIALRGTLHSVRIPETLAMLSAPIPHATHLDLSGLHASSHELYIQNAENVTIDDVLFDHVPDAALFDHIESVTLGHWHDEARAEAFAGRGIRVEG